MVDLEKLPRDANGAVVGKRWEVILRAPLTDGLGSTRFESGRSVPPVSGQMLAHLVCALGADVLCALRYEDDDDPSGHPPRVLSSVGDVPSVLDPPSWWLSMQDAFDARERAIEAALPAPEPPSRPQVPVPTEAQPTPAGPEAAPLVPPSLDPRPTKRRRGY